MVSVEGFPLILLCHWLSVLCLIGASTLSSVVPAKAEITDKAQTRTIIATCNCLMFVMWLPKGATM